MTVPPSLLAVLQVLRPCFIAPTFRTFSALVTGLIVQTGRRTVVGMLLGAGLTRIWPHDRAHYFFARARWSCDQLGLALARLIVEQLLPEHAALQVAVDDTLFKRRGRKAHGAAWQHDGAAAGPKQTGFGNNWVMLGLLVPLPFLPRPVCLPVLARLWRPGQEVSKVDLARDLVGVLLAAFPRRQMHLVGDAAYHGKALRDLPERRTWTTRKSCRPYGTCSASPHNRESRELYETHPARSEAMIHLATTDLMACRLTGESTISWRNPASRDETLSTG